MKKKLNDDEIENWIEEHWSEIEPKIVKDICIQFNLGSECEKKTLKETHMGLGFVRIVWKTKKKILRRDYGLNWKSPVEKYPDIIYD